MTFRQKEFLYLYGSMEAAAFLPMCQAKVPQPFCQAKLMAKVWRNRGPASFFLRIVFVAICNKRQLLPLINEPFKQQSI